MEQTELEEWRTRALSSVTAKVRLDSLLAERGLFESRTRAAASVMAGEVLIGPDRRRAAKPGQMVETDLLVSVADVKRFVSRGGIKLSNALDLFEINCEGKRVLDAGASTGGFTDCVLQRGAEHVIAVDVAYGELAWSLRDDARVTVIERTNIRELRVGSIAYRPNLVVCDLSFIGLAKVLPALLDLVDKRFDLCALVKPQFEVGRARVGKGGVVRDPNLRREALLNVGEFVVEKGYSVLGYASSGLPGPKGNCESFIHVAEAERSPVILDLQEAVKRAEP